MFEQIHGIIILLRSLKSFPLYDNDQFMPLSCIFK